LAAKASRTFKAAPGAIARAILTGYKRRLAREAKPFVLEERHPELRAMAYHAEKEPAKVWQKIEDDSSPIRVPAKVSALLRNEMPARGRKIDFRHRRNAGMGSLGRPRYLARAVWGGGLVAHEAKAILPSAAAWAAGRNNGQSSTARSRSAELLAA